METFYAVPVGGQVMTRDQLEKSDPEFFDPNRSASSEYGYVFQPGAPPPDAPGESENFGGVYNTRLVAGAKRDFEDADPETVRK